MTLDDVLDTWRDSPVVRSLCENCGDPGRCCKDIKLTRKAFGGITKLECLVILATIEHPDPHMLNTGLPFLPEYVGEDEQWRFSCPRLREDGRCGDYENRPNLCRTFVPGAHHPCVMTKWWGIPDGS